VFREVFDLDRAIVFGFIWAALALFMTDSLRRARRAATA
jgi:EamA domain-containing membrane protein RarD